MRTLASRTYRSIARSIVGRHVARAPFPLELGGRGRHIKAHVPRHCGCERCVHGLEHLPLQAVLS